MSIKNFKKNLQPREKARINGVETLDDAELLAIFLRTGTKSHNVLFLAHKILHQYHNLYFLSKANQMDLVKISGIGHIKAIELLAIFELATRIVKTIPVYIVSAVDAANYVFPIIAHNLQELFFILLINDNNSIAFQKTISIGQGDSSLVNVKLILKELLKHNARRFYCFHNHPSGNVAPSRADIFMTKTLIQYCSMFEIELIEHIIVNHKHDYHFVLDGL